jgi:hypothetical protein
MDSKTNKKVGKEDDGIAPTEDPMVLVDAAPGANEPEANSKSSEATNEITLPTKTRSEEINNGDATMETATSSVLHATETEEEARSDDEEAAEQWELKKIMTAADVNKKKPVKCTSCDLCAAVLYVEATTSVKWYGCLDCQVRCANCIDSLFSIHPYFDYYSSSCILMNRKLRSTMNSVDGPKTFRNFPSIS